MKEQFLNISADADQKQKERFDAWLAGEGIPFTDENAATAYRERVTLIKVAVQLQKTPARIPICPSAGFFPLQYAGVSMYDAMYDYEIPARAWQKYCDDFTPDAYNAPSTVVPGKPLDILDFQLCKWPGQGVSHHQEYQYVEKEYMKADEYQDLIDDPTGYFMGTYFPRIFGTLKPFKKMPLFPPVNEIPCIPPTLIPFGTDAFQQAFESLMAAGQETIRWILVVRPHEYATGQKDCRTGGLHRRKRTAFSVMYRNPRQSPLVLQKPHGFYGQGWWLYILDWGRHAGSKGR